MAQENSSNWISSLVGFIKLTIVAIVLWAVIAMGAYGLYNYYRKKVLGLKYDDMKAEDFGNKVFLIWLVVSLITPFLLADTFDQSTFNTLFNMFLLLQVIFIGGCVFGLIYALNKVV